MQEVSISPLEVMRFINFWPPFLFAGIHVISFDPDMRHAEVGLRLTWWNRNRARTQFGGNIYSMTDPFYPLMLMAHLGPSYAIWDESARIEFITPGRTALRAKFHLSLEKIQEIRAATAGDGKYLAQFRVEIVDANNNLVANVDKVIYVRPKRAASLTQ